MISIETALWWAFLNIITCIILAFYSMGEMACVSFNKIRLHYYVSKGMKRAVWLNYLIQNPTRLFGTTLIGVNVAMFVGSECARQFYLSLGLNPDIAPLTQVAFVVVFAELAPMFAARRYAEHVAFLCAPILYASAKLMQPLLWSIGIISNIVDVIFGGKGLPEHLALNQEDLQHILAVQDEDRGIESEGETLNTVTRNIFTLRSKNALTVMQNINSIPILPSNSTVEQLRQILKKPHVKYVPIYHRSPSHIVGIADPRDLIRIPDSKRVRDYASPPWFITKHSGVIQILREFRHNNQSVAVVLNDQGLAIGIITLEDLIEEIFGKLEEGTEIAAAETPKKHFIIDRTFPGDMKVAEFNAQFDVLLDEDGDLTLADLMIRELGHNPEVGESVYIPPFELTVAETSLTEIKKITVTTRMR